MRIAEQKTLGTTLGRSPRLAGALAVTLLLGIGICDVLTSRETSLMLLYFVPVSIAALWVGGRMAISISIAAGLIATATRIAGRPLEPVDFWNAATRLAILLSWALLLGRLRTQPGSAGPVLRQLRWTLSVTMLLGLLASGAYLLIEADSSGTQVKSVADAPKLTPRLEGPLGDLIVELQDCLAISRPVLLGSRDPAGASCVSVIKTGAVQDSLPSNIADYNGGPGTTMAALYFFDRAGIKNSVEDFNWHQTRLRRFLENQLAVNEHAAEVSAKLAQKARELAEQLDHADTLPSTLKATGYRDTRNWPGFCLMSLDSAVGQGDVASVRRWATEFAAATFSLEDLHRWLGFLVENQLQSLAFQKLGASLYVDPSVADPNYDTHKSIGLYPGGLLALNGVTNYLEVERQAERLLTVPTDWAPALAPATPWKHGSTWVVPGERECYMKVFNALSPANQKTWRQAAKAPYEHSYMASMLFRAWKSDSADALVDSMRRFDAAHPNATMDELMDAIMYRGHAFAGIEWADRYQLELLNPLHDAPIDSDLTRLLAAAQLTSRFNRGRGGYGMTFTLRDALSRRIFDCVRATDMIAAIHRNTGGTRFGFVHWSAGSHGHSAAAHFDLQDSQPRTLMVDGMSHAPQLEAWPEAFFNGHAWPPGFDGNPAPYSAELMARGIDNYVWLEGYIIRGPTAGTLVRAAVPYLPAREKSDQQKVFAGPYPP